MSTDESVPRLAARIPPESVQLAVSPELDKPLYVQIHEYLAERIFTGEIPPESKLPSERELSRDLEISRMTVRRAITELVNEGLLTRRQGSGTYVAAPRVLYEARELVSYSRAMQARGIAVRTQILEFCQVPASRRLAEHMDVEIGHTLYRVGRLRLANRIPAILERAYFSSLRTPRLEDYDLERTSVHALLTSGYGLAIRRVAQTVEAVSASDTVAQQLRVAEGGPLLLLSLTLYGGEDGKPIAYRQDFLRSEYARIRFEMET